MATPTEHKTVQTRILAYAQEIGWKYVPREEAERRRGVDPDGITSEDYSMLHQLMTAQIQVHDLDLEEILHDLLQKLATGRFNHRSSESGAGVIFDISTSSPRKSLPTSNPPSNNSAKSPPTRGQVACPLFASFIWQAYPGSWCRRILWAPPFPPPDERSLPRSPGCPEDQHRTPSDPW
mgnify:CR=1 FL=1